MIGGGTPPARGLPTTNPGIYVHIPFCAKICPYCDFAVARGDRDARRRFVEQLLAEIKMSRVFEGAAPGSPFDTIYFGGGTPSILEPDQIGSIVDALQASFPVAEKAWIALEANPEDVVESAGKLKAWQGLGVGGVSFGVQSFDTDELRFLGRKHTPHDARAAVEAALAAGFDWVSVDLIYGLPDQSLDALQRNLDATIALAPHHISCYQLTIHEGTPFFRREQRGLLKQLGNSALGDFFLRTHKVLGQHGYPAYEVSNFARTPEDRSPHNQKYWYHTPYLGLGPSAHSFDGRERWWNERNHAAYQSLVASGQRPIAEREQLTGEQRALEEAMLALRTVRGIDTAGFYERHGVDLVEQNRDLLLELEENALLADNPGHIALTTAGLAIVDGITPRLQL